MNNYLNTAPIGQMGGISNVKIEWIKYNFSKFFKGKNATYLDIGPGQGEVLILWKKMGFKNINSVDISSGVYEHIKKLGFNCILVDNTEAYLKNNKEKFDFIMLNDVIEHIPKNELVSFMQNVYLSLKINGRVIIKVPNAQSPHFSIGRYDDLTHVQSFTEKSLYQLLKVAKFKKVNIYPEKFIVRNFKDSLVKYFTMPIYFWWIRKIRGASGHFSPKILTQAIIAIVHK